MGACLSSSGDSISRRSNTALVVSVKGDLRPYSTPVFVSDVLLTETGSSSSFFLCNSDNLYYDEYIKALDMEDELDAGQIYFILPTTKLRTRLTASDMAALAVKASVALNSNVDSKTVQTTTTSTSTSKEVPKRKNKAKISPFVVMETSQINVIVDEEFQNKRIFEKQQASLGVSRSGSIRKMQRYSSRKARLAVRSFKLRLSTINESEATDQAQVY